MARQREDRVNQSIEALLRAMGPVLRVRDVEAAARVVHFSLEALAHQAAILGSDVEGKRLSRECADMLARYLVDG